MEHVSRRFLATFGSFLLVMTGLPSTFAQAAQRDEARSSIIVDGQAITIDAARQRAAQFIQGTGVASGNTPAARWADPVCPRVIGLQERGARSAEARIRAIAEAAGVETAAEPCDSNIVIMFTPDPAAVMRDIDRRSAGRLSQVSPTARGALLNGTAPIRWWYSAETRGRHGDGSRRMPQGHGGTTTNVHDGSGAGQALGGEVPTMSHYDNSIISTMTQRVLVSAGVVIDQDAVIGRRLDTIAAYAALVALAEIRSQDSAPEGSILNMFAAAEPPRGLTLQDQAFLRALYQMPMDREARRHRSHLVGEMVAAVSN